MDSGTPYRHVGAYGLLEHDGRILLIRKSRGAYRGWLDLPGGGIEFGEDPVAALHREFDEETGLVLTDQTLIAALSNRVCYRTDTGEMEDLHHLGLIYTVTAASHDGLKEGLDGEDSAGAIWIDRGEVERCDVTPFVRETIAILSS